MTVDKDSLAIVIPYFNASKHITKVVKKVSAYSNHIVIVDDCSPEKLPKDLFQLKNVSILHLEKNLGVGGATLTGLKFFKDKKNIEVLIKVDADDQMDTAFIPELVNDVNNGFGFVKGNRFRDFKTLKQMPKMRRFGNFLLSFFSKVATGYWNLFDFNNGFFAISNKTFKQIDSSYIKYNYFFETSLIAELYYHRVSIKEIAMPAIYGDEKSNMKLMHMPMLFLKNLVKLFYRRLFRSYFVYDFNIGSIYMIFSFIFLFCGLTFGGYNWYKYSSQDLLTPLGTIMISTLLIILGFQLLLQFIQFDILNTPKNDK